MLFLSLVTLTFVLWPWHSNSPSEGPNTSSVWNWRKSVQRFPRYFIHKKATDSGINRTLRSSLRAVIIAESTRHCMRYASKQQETGFHFFVHREYCTGVDVMARKREETLEPRRWISLIASESILNTRTRRSVLQQLTTDRRTERHTIDDLIVEWQMKTRVREITTVRTH